MEEEELISNLTKKINEHPALEDYIERGNAYWSLEKYDKVVLDYTSALEFDNCPAEVYFYRAGAYHRLGDTKSALKDINKAIKLIPSVKSYLGRAEIYKKIRNYKKAIKDYSCVIEMEPDYIKAYEYRADCYYETGNHSLAINDYNKVLEVDSNNIDIINSRTFSYWQFKNQLNNVISGFTKIIELEPKHYKAYTDRAHAYFQNKEYEKSIQDYEKFIELEKDKKPDDYYQSYLDIDFAKGRIGICQTKLKLYDIAIKNLQEALKFHQYYGFYFALSVCLFKKKIYFESLINFLKAMKDHANDFSRYWKIYCKNFIKSFIK